MKFPKPWFRKGRGWFVTLDGKQTKLGVDREEALARYQQLLAEPRQAVIPTGSLLAIIDGFLDWSQKHRAAATYEWYRDRLERFAQRYPDLRVGDLRPYHVQEWLDAMAVSSGTKRNYGRAVKRCLRWAHKQGYIDRNPIADLELPQGGKREQVVSPMEWKTLLNAVSVPAFRELLVVTWETGCRPQESLPVEARHVDLVHQRWVFAASESKSDMPRIVYLTDKALAIVTDLMRRYPSGPLFRNSRGKRWTTDAVNCAFTRIQIKLGRQQLEQDIQQRPSDRRRKYIGVDDTAARELARTLSRNKQSGRRKSDAELLHEARRKLAYRAAMEVGPKYSLYVLRHSWMNRLLTRGVDSLTVAFLAGHADPGTLAKFYAHLSNDPAYLLKQAKRGTG